MDATTWDREKILSELKNYEGVVIRSRIPVDLDFFQAATKLKCIGRFGAGLENIDLDLAAKHGVTCLNVPEGNRQAVGEHALALLLNLMNHIRRADQQVRNGIWDRHGNTGTELSGKTIGIIGLGNMGQSFAKVLSGFDVNIIAYDPYIAKWPMSNVESVSLEELQSKADIVSIHTPLTAETKGWLNRAFWNALTKPIYFINTARGPIVDTQDLLNAIEEGKVVAAGLDVLEFESKSFHLQKENPVFQQLIAEERVILTPHIGGWTTEAFEKMGKILAEKMIGVLK